MIKFDFQPEGRKKRKWLAAAAFSISVHVFFLVVLLLIPEKVVKSFTSSMDFTVVKKKNPAGELQPTRRQEVKGKKIKRVVKKKIKRVTKKKLRKVEENTKPISPATPLSPPPKFQMSGSSFSSSGTWSLRAEIGENRIGSLSGSPDGKPIFSSSDMGTGSGVSGDSTRVKPKPVVKVKPKVVHEERVEYPEEARMMEIAGDVLLEVYIDRNGNVSSVRVLKEPGGGLGKAAAKALKKFKFTPALSQYGTPMPCKIKYVYSFVLD